MESVCECAVLLGGGGALCICITQVTDLESHIGLMYLTALTLYKGPLLCCCPPVFEPKRYSTDVTAILKKKKKTGFRCC